MKKLFNTGWSFKEFPLNTEFEVMNTDDTLSKVDIPHDWMIWHTKDLYKDGIGFYKKTFFVEKAIDHTYFIRFEGVYMDSRIYLNGELIGEWKYGYSTFDINLTDKLINGENTVCVTCTFQNLNSRWYSGAGIYRNVYFIDKPKTYINNDGIYISTKLSSDNEYTLSKKAPSYASIDGEDFTVTVDTEVISKDCCTVKIIHTVVDINENIITTHEDLLDCKADIVNINTTSFIVKAPKLWDIDSPNMYRLITRIAVDDCDMDVINNPLGFRTIAFDPNKGFFLNGRNIKINGACQHHDLGSLGAAVNKTALRRQFKKLMDMGVNSIRTSHNMPAKEVLELADELGILIYTESFDMWELSKTEFDYARFFPEWYEKDVESWVRRDINHPSLFIWGIGNEIYDTHTEKGFEWTKLLRDKVRSLDYRNNAYIAIGSNYIEWDNAQKCSNILDLSGYNYGERLYDAHHKKYPDWVIFGSETASTVQSRGIYHFPYENKLLTFVDDQCSALGNCTTNWGARDVDIVITEHRDREYVFGQYIWTGWDYIGEPTPYFSKNSFFGQIDTAGFLKDTYYHYQAEWVDYHKKPMVHLLPYWDFNEGQIIDICAYSNAPYVELFFNDESLGKQFIDHQKGLTLQGRWKMPYKEGELKVVATDENGDILATDIQRSFKDPRAIKLIPDKTEFSNFSDDLIFIEISTVDENGTFVANARNRINVKVTGEGRLIGLDNGDSTDYEEYKGNNRKLFSGKLLAIIARNKNAGSITVTATSNGLNECSVILKSPESCDDTNNEFLLSNFDVPVKDDIPVRKIELTRFGDNHLNADNKESKVAFKVYPENATYNDVTIKALTLDGIEANFVKLNIEENIVNISAVGDGEFRLTATCNNGMEHAEVVSELEFSIEGLGKATLNPYDFVHGCQFSQASVDNTKLSFLGGIQIPTIGESNITFENVDFGEFGSDTVSIPIFTFHDELDLEVWEGLYETGECLGKFKYQAKTWYNHYQENTFKLSRRVKGTTTLTFVFKVDDRLSLKGFSFDIPNKAYSLINATENSRITGDSFNVAIDGIKNIGNNVSIDFDNMNFNNGIKSITLCGCSHNEKTSIHLLFMDNDKTIRQMIEIPYSEDCTETTIELDSININCKLSLVFLPGSNFDLKWFKFS